VKNMRAVSTVATVFSIVIIAVGIVSGVIALDLTSSGRNGTVRQLGSVRGWVTIGPLCPVEPCHSTENPYNSRSLVLTSGSTNLFVPLQSDGSFYANVTSGLYQVTLTNCVFLGCHNLPVTVNVAPGATARLNITIDTGIR
jgi:hypothetical protein